VICEAFIELYPTSLLKPDLPQSSHPGYALLKIMLEISSVCNGLVADIVQICSLYLLNVLAMNKFQEGKDKVLSLLDVRHEKNELVVAKRYHRVQLLLGFLAERLDRSVDTLSDEICQFMHFVQVVMSKT
jgi:hypothetical protein